MKLNLKLGYLISSFFVYYYRESLKNNILRTFSMPIYKEISNISVFPLWKHVQSASIPINLKSSQRQVALLLPEASEYIRKIGEHFISFIHKLDSSQITVDFDQRIALYQSYCVPQQTRMLSSSSEYWINELGKFLVQTITQKYLKINSLS